MFAVGGRDRPLPQLVSLRERLIQSSVAVDDYVGDGQPLGITRLRPDTLDGLIACETSQCDHSRNPGLCIGVNHDDQVEFVGSGALSQKRHVVDHDGIGVGRAGFSEMCAGCREHRGMCDAIESRALLRVAEDDRSEGRAIERSVGEDHASPELASDGRQGGRSRLDHLTRHSVGIHDHGPVLAPSPCDNRFSGCYSAGQPNHIHAPMLAASKC